MTATTIASLLMLLVVPQQVQPEPPAVKHEIERLQACHPVFKLTPPPINARLVWTQPFDVVWSSEDQNHVSIEFSIQYAESDFYETRQEAEHAQSFNPLFNLRQRSHYILENGNLRLLWRESLLDSKWKRQDSTAPDFSCWQTSPSTPSQ